MNITARISSTATLPLLLQDGTLAEALPRVAEHIRHEPQNTAHRLLYADLLCLTGSWAKALPQWQMCARLDPSLTPLAYVCRQLLRAELFRAAVFAGQHKPALPEDCPHWVQPLWEALHLPEGPRASALQTQRADDLRTQALEQASTACGLAHCAKEEKAFTWISDSDSRLGPVLEACIQGRYWWLPLCQVQRVDLAQPRSLRDLIWLPAVFVLDKGECAGFVPGRYPASEHAGEAWALGRQTSWHDVGTTGVWAVGQKMWISDGGDLPAYDTRRLTLRAQP